MPLLCFGFVFERYYCLPGLKVIVETKTDKLGWLLGIDIPQVSFKMHKSITAFSTYDIFMASNSKAEYFDSVHSISLAQLVFILSLALCSTSCISKTPVYLFSNNSS